jgi:hypothetical protein
VSLRGLIGEKSLYSVKAARSARRKPGLRAALGRRPRPSNDRRTAPVGLTGVLAGSPSSPAPPVFEAGPDRSDLRTGSYEGDGSDQAEGVAKDVARYVIDLERWEPQTDRYPA